MPQEIINYIAKNFNNIYGSPFSSSFYSESGQTWDYTPKNQIRVSDHWNFFSRDYNDSKSELKQHAITNTNVSNNSHWSIGKKNNKGVYEIIMSIAKKEILPKKYNFQNDLLAQKEPNEYLFLQQRKKNIKEYEAKKIKREAKIKAKKQWVKFDRSYTIRLSSNNFKRIDEVNIFKILVGESKDYITVYDEFTGLTERFKKSTLFNYKELARKPIKK